jgi:pyrroloquinoline quinone biosynthesis protein D
VRLFWDDVRQQHFLLFPEGAIKLNQTAWAILERCDRHHSIEQIIAELMIQFPDANLASDVFQLIDQITRRGLLRDEPP